MKVLVLDGVANEGLKILENEPGITVDISKTIPEDQLITIINEYDAVIVRSATKINKKVMSCAHKLKVIGRAGVGVDNIDLEEATRRGILVVNAPGGNTISATEYTMAMMLALARNIPRANYKLKNGIWDKKALIGTELSNKTLGIIGLGRIGFAVAKRAQAMDMHIIAYDPYISEKGAISADIELLELNDLFKRSDFITIHTPKTNSTRHILNQEAFSKMKDGVRIINCARGGIVDEIALYDALKSGKVAGAALDVFEEEPQTNSPLYELNNVIVSPHIGASTREAQYKVAANVAQEVLAALKGKMVKNTVNVPAIKNELINELKPYIKLVEKMGRFQSQIITTRVKKIQVSFSGGFFKQTDTLTAAFVKGFLDPILQENVNFINAIVLAKERGIEIEQVNNPTKEGYSDLITVRVFEDDDDSTISGGLFQGDPRIVEVNGYRIDSVPEGHMLIIPHVDKPGMIGLVGTILGEHNINISGMQNSRKKTGATSMMVISVDLAVPEEVLKQIRQAEDILDVKMINI